MQQQGGADEPRIAYGGRVGAADFVLFPLPVVFAGLPMFLPGPSWIAWGMLAYAILGMLGLVVCSTNALDARAWVGGSRVQLPLILSCLFLGEVVWFASLFWLISHADPAAFSEGLDRVGAVYFSLTTMTTTGFGDISAHSHSARVAASVEMICSVLTVVVLVATAASRSSELVERPATRVLENTGDHT